MAKWKFEKRTFLPKFSYLMLTRPQAARLKLQLAVEYVRDICKRAFYCAVHDNTVRSRRNNFFCPAVTFGLQIFRATVAFQKSHFIFLIYNKSFGTFLK